MDNDKRRIGRHKLRIALDEFSRKMMERLIEKLNEDYVGWNMLDWEKGIIDRLYMKSSRLYEPLDPKNDNIDVKKECVDIANFAMFLYHLEERKPKSAKKIDISYDQEHDILYIEIGPPVAALSKPLIPGVYIRREGITDAVAGIIIERYSQRNIETLLEMLPITISKDLLP